MPPELTLDQITDSVSDKLGNKISDSFNNLLAEYEQKKAGQSNGRQDQPWWVGLSNEAPQPATIIHVKEDGGYEVLDHHEGLDRMMSYTFGAAITQPIEKPLNDIFPQLPLGSIAIGGGAGLIVNDLVDAFVPETTTDATTGATSANMLNPLIKIGVGVGVPAMLGTRLMSRTGNLFFAGSLVIIAAQQLLPLDQWITSLVNWVRGLFGGTTTTGNLNQRLTAQQIQARQIAAQRQRELNAGGGGTITQGQSPGIDNMHDPLRAVL